jgi:hypothetical protein
MAIVNEKHSPSKPVQVDPKTGKPLPASSTPARAASPVLDVMNDGNGGFLEVSLLGVIRRRWQLWRRHRQL